MFPIILKNGKHLFYPQGGDILSKRFYKLYHYVAETFYPDVVDQKVCDIAFWFGDRYCGSQNKLCKLFWFIIFHTYWIISGIEQFCSEKLLYLIGKTFYPKTGEYKQYDEKLKYYMS